MEYRYRHVGAHIEDLDDGRSVAPGEYTSLDEELLRQPRTEELVAEGTLIPAEEEESDQSEAEKEAKLAERRSARKTKEEKEGDTDD